MQVAKEWGLKPEEFNEKEFTEQAKMIAESISTKIIEAFNYEISEAHAKQQAKKSSYNINKGSKSHGRR